MATSSFSLWCVYSLALAFTQEGVHSEIQGRWLSPLTILLHLFIWKGVWKCHQASVKVREQLTGSWFSPSPVLLGMGLSL